jgi:hypothetical protein
MLSLSPFFVYGTVDSRWGKSPSTGTEAGPLVQRKHSGDYEGLGVWEVAVRGRRLNGRDWCFIRVDLNAKRIQGLHCSVDRGGAGQGF